MKKFLAALAILLPVVMSFAEERKAENWKGYVTDTWCGVNRDNKTPTAECTRECVETKGARYAFYNVAEDKVYLLMPQSEAAKYAGQRVTITGSVDHVSVPMKTMRGDREGNTITASLISPDQL